MSSRIPDYLEQNRIAWDAEAAAYVAPAERAWSLLGNSTLLMLCTPDGPETPATPSLQRGFFEMHRFEWPDDDPPATEFHLGHGDWIRLLRANGFEVLDLIELQAPAGAETSYDFVNAEWARRWPSEEAWRARKVG